MPWASPPARCATTTSAAHLGVDAALGLVALVLGLTAWPAARAAAQVTRGAEPQVSEEQEPATA